MAGATVAGFDVGNCTSCVALARKRGIDVIMNRESKRETPAMVSFGDKMRFIGTDGAAKQVANLKNTVVQVKRLIGKRFQDPDVQDDIKKFPFKISEGPNGGISIDVMFAGEMASFTPEQILAMVLKDLKKIADEEGAPITDCVLTVPVYFTEAQRYAMLNAASVAGLNCLRLMNETTATALAYGIYKTDLPADEPTYVAFVDFGHSSLQVCVVELRKGQLEVKSHAWDPRTGGRDFDEALYEHFCDEFKQKYRLDVRSNAKAGFKLRASLDKVKRMLSANPEAPLNIECLMEDTDVRSMMTRDKFEELAGPLLERILGPCQQALEASGLSKEELANVELVGAASRIPAVARIVREFFGREPSRTLNTKFDVKDSNPYAVELRWESDGEAKSQRIFGKGNAVPSLKAITLKKAAPFSLQLHYADDSGVPETVSKHLGTYEVANFKVPPGEDKATLKVQIRMNLHGLVAVDSVHSLMEEEYEETVQPEPAPEAEPGAAGAAAPMDTDANGAAAGSDEAAPAAAADAAADAQADSTAAASMETDAPAAADAAPAVAPPQVVKKKRTRKTDVPVGVAHRGGLSDADLNRLLEVEGQMSAADRLQEETNEAKNALETYVYMLRGRLSDQLVEYVKEDARTQLMTELDAMEDWLYDEGEDVMKSVYVEKLAALRGRGEPVELRYSEAQTREQAVAELAAAAERYSAQASAPDAKLAHLTPEELAKVLEECRTVSSWLQDRLQMQSQLHKHEEPALLTADIKKKFETLCRACDAVLSKPPPSKKPEPKEDAEAAAAAGDEGGQPMDTDAAAAADDKPGDADAAMET